MKDRFWQIIAATAAVVAIIVAIGTYYLSQRASKRALTAEVISSSTLVKNEITTTSKDLRLIYKNKVIPNVAVSSVRFSNAGRQPIRTSDIEVPLSIKLECIEIISSKVTDSNPPDLPISTNNEVSSVVISKTLLNSGDDFTIEIVSVQNSAEGVVVSGVGGRIAGIGQIEFKTSPQKDKIKLDFWNVLLLSFLGGCIGALSIFLPAFIYWELSTFKQVKAEQRQ